MSFDSYLVHLYVTDTTEENSVNTYELALLEPIWSESAPFLRKDMLELRVTRV